MQLHGYPRRLGIGDNEINGAAENGVVISLKTLSHMN